MTHTPPYTVKAHVLSSPELITTLQSLAKQFVIITDDTVASLYGHALQQQWGSHFECHLLAIAPGERNKTRAMKAKLEDELLSLGCLRETCLIALGGGVITDLTGFIAATYCRGVPCVYCPTTLLAMVDASVGGKTGVNTEHGKNLIGVFRQPSAVFCDPLVLKTLPDIEWHSGFIEGIKHVILSDRNTFHRYAGLDIQTLDTLQLSALISQSMQIKAEIVAKDPHDTGCRQILNLGHTLGHALESASAYQIKHGIAVGLGIVGEAYLAWQLGLLSEDDFTSLTNFFNPTYFAPYLPRITWCTDEIVSKCFFDKKNKEGIRIVLLQKIGQVYHHEESFTVQVAPKALTLAINWLIRTYAS